jgi:hypothetical protein
MNFLAPSAFFLAFLLPVIVIMYLLKLRRQKQQVSSIFLWERLVRDIEANAPWQRLTRNLIMFLQLLFLLALIFALAEPSVFAAGTGSESLILIIDNSGSMAAKDTSPSRLEAAKSQARTFIYEAAEGTRITVIEAGNQTEILVSASQDRRQVLRAIDTIQQSFSGSDLSTALQLTAAITRRQPNTDIYIFSDGKTGLPERLNLSGNLYYYPIGVKTENQGISNIQFQQNASGDNNTLFIQVTNYGDQDITRNLEIYLDDQLYDVASIELNGYAKETYFRDGIPLETQVVTAKLSNEDYLPLDDQAWIVPKNIKPVNILLVTEGNRFLEIALSLLPNANLEATTPVQFEQSDIKDQDITIFDAYLPPIDLLPQTSLLFIAPPQENSFFSVNGKVVLPHPRKIDPQDPVLSGISVGGLNIFEAQSIPLPEWAKMSIAGDADENSVPLLFYGKSQGRKIAVLSFKLQHSDLPLQVAFPLLTANLVNWLSPDIPGPEERLESSDKSFYVPAETTQVFVRAPDGSTSLITPKDGGLILLADVQPGIYSMTWGENQFTQVAVNFFSPNESDIEPATQLEFQTNTAASSVTLQNQSRRVFWRPLALFALALLTGEWLIYHRGTISKLWLSFSTREKI